MKSLLVATDLSQRSDRAVNRALALSDELNAKLVVLHVVDQELPHRIGESVQAEAELIIDKQLDKFPSLKRGEITRKVVFGIGARNILWEAEEGAADLIILGTHRELSFAGLFLGTTVERVIRLGNDPVLVVKSRVKGPYSRVLVAVDFSVYSRRAVEFALKFVPHGEFFLVHAFDVPFKSFAFGQPPLEEVSGKRQAQMDSMLDEEMQAFLATLDPCPSNLKKIFREGPARTVITEQVETLNPDLLVVGTHGRTGVAHAFLGSVAQDLLSDPPCDILAVKAW